MADDENTGSNAGESGNNSGNSGPKDQKPSSQSWRAGSQHPGAPQILDIWDVPPTNYDYLWKKTLPIGEVTTLEGAGGVGKSWVALAWCAELAKAGKTCVYISTEDDSGGVVRPRLEILKAPQNAYQGPPVKVIKENAATQEHDRIVIPTEGLNAKPLLDLIRKTKLDLLVFNPLTAYIPKGYSLFDPVDCRKMINMLSILAKEYRFGVLLVRHFARRKVEDEPGTRAMGSVELTNAVRQSWYVLPHPDWPAEEQGDVKRVLVCQSKNNIGIFMPSLAFELRPHYFSWIDTRNISYEEAVKTVLSPQTPEARQLIHDATRWLEALFALHMGNQKRLQEHFILQEAQAAGFSPPVIRGCRSRLGVTVEYDVKVDPNLAQDLKAAGLKKPKQEAMWRWTSSTEPRMKW